MSQGEIGCRQETFLSRLLDADLTTDWISELDKRSYLELALAGGYPEARAREGARRHPQAGWRRPRRPPSHRDTLAHTVEREGTASSGLRHVRPEGLTKQGCLGYTLALGKHREPPSVGVI
ncbi:MAG: hypothetical protein ABIZ05_04405 [Pseudonocardiaceae bacterium]